MLHDCKYYVIGDIHGCFHTLKSLIDNVICPRREDTIFFVGDYIDRGPRSKQVLDFIMERQSEGLAYMTLRGNHEQMLLDYLDKKNNGWLFNGADKTLESFNLKSGRGLDKKYEYFIRRMPYFYILNDFIIVHAGLNCNIKDPLLDTEAMLWTRDQYTDLSKTGNRRVIAGHSPKAIDLVRDSLEKPKISIDSGCVYAGFSFGMGYLSAVEIKSMRLFIHKNID